MHRALWELLNTIDSIEEESEREKLRREIFERLVELICVYPHSNSHASCQDVLAEMVHTKDGSRAVREFIVQGTAKVRFLVCMITCIRHTIPGPETYHQSDKAPR